MEPTRAEQIMVDILNDEYVSEEIGIIVDTMVKFIDGSEHKVDAVYLEYSPSMSLPQFIGYAHKDDSSYENITLLPADLHKYGIDQYLTADGYIMKAYIEDCIIYLEENGFI